MPYVQRNDAGAIIGLYANSQSFASDFLADDDPIVVAYRSAHAPASALSLDDFTALFTTAEQAAIYGSADWRVRQLIAKATASGVQLSKPSVQAGVNYLASINLVAQSRVAQVLAGQTPSS